MAIDLFISLDEHYFGKTLVRVVMVILLCAFSVILPIVLTFSDIWLKAGRVFLIRKIFFLFVFKIVRDSGKAYFVTGFISEITSLFSVILFSNLNTLIPFRLKTSSFLPFRFFYVITF